jgi:hypothetical protein
LISPTVLAALLYGLETSSLFSVQEKYFKATHS